MGSTELSKRGVSFDRLTDRRKRFVLAYCQHQNGKRAAIEAGYSKKSAPAMSVKLLKDPLVKKAIGNIQYKDRQKFEIERDDILRRLAQLCLRDPSGLWDPKTGKIRPLHKMPHDVVVAIDGVKQKVRRYYDENGEPVETVETDLKLVSQMDAVRAAMQHKGLFAPEKGEVTHRLNWDELYQRPIGGNTAQEEIDAIEVEFNDG